MEISERELERLIDERATRLVETRLREMGFDCDHPREQYADNSWTRSRRVGEQLTRQTIRGAIWIAVVGAAGTAAIWALEVWKNTRP